MLRCRAPIRAFLDVGLYGLCATQSIKVNQVPFPICTVGMEDDGGYLLSAHLVIDGESTSNDIPSYAGALANAGRIRAYCLKRRLELIAGIRERNATPNAYRTPIK